MNIVTLPHLSDAEKNRFYAKIDKTPGFGPQGTCWLWTAGKTGQMGYGAFAIRRQGKSIRANAHRFAYFLAYGVDPQEMCVLHKCDTPLCVNEAHLFLGTKLDNAKDRVQKRRSPTGEKHWMKQQPEAFAKWKLVAKGKLNLPKPEDNPMTVLTADIVREIRRRSAQGEGNRPLAKEFNVTHSNISAIVLRKSWKHIE